MNDTRDDANNDLSDEVDLLKGLVGDLLTYRPNPGTLLWTKACEAIGRQAPPVMHDIGGEHPSPVARP